MCDSTYNVICSDSYHKKETEFSCDLLQFRSLLFVEHTKTKEICLCVAGSHVLISC